MTTCETETGSFTVSAVNGLQYSIGGDYQSSGSFTGLAAGTYNVTAKNTDGCESQATSVTIEEQPIGATANNDSASTIEDNSVKQVYPPSSLALNPKFFTNPNKPS